MVRTVRRGARERRACGRRAWLSTMIVALLLGTSSSAGAQPQRPSDYYWLSGGLAYSRFSMELGDAPSASRNGMSIRMGLRICVLCALGVKRLTVTPGLVYGITDLRGVDPPDEPYAFSRLDFGAQVAYTIPRARLRPYVSLWPAARRTTEVATAGSTIQNYRDTSGDPATTFGLEIPITPEGRGIDINFTAFRGSFTEREPSDIPAGSQLKYKGRVISIGWSGPFTGAGLPWR